MIVQQQHYEALPVGEYAAKIGEIEVQAGQWGPQLKFQFDLLDDGLEDRYVIGWCSQTFSPKSKLFKWSQAAFRREIPPEYDLNTDHLLGRSVILVIVTRTGEDGTEYNRIEGVKAACVAVPAPIGPGGVATGAVVMNQEVAPVPETAPAWLGEAA